MIDMVQKAVKVSGLMGRVFFYPDPVQYRVFLGVMVVSTLSVYLLHL